MTAINPKVNAGGGLGGIVSWAYSQIVGEAMPPEVAAAITALFAWLAGYLRSQ